MDAHPFFILEFICCQFAACLFFGISLIKYFLFSPLSPWLLTLLPTLTIVCCGKFLLVDFFPPLSPFFFPYLFFVLHCGNPNFILPKSYANSRTLPHVPGQAVLPATSTQVSWVWHCFQDINTSGGFFCLCVCSLNKRQINSFCLTKLLGKSLFMLRHENSKTQVCTMRLPVNSNRRYLQKNQYWRTCDSWQHCKGPWVKIEQENNNA